VLCRDLTIVYCEDRTSYIAWKKKIFIFSVAPGGAFSNHLPYLTIQLYSPEWALASSTIGFSVFSEKDLFYVIRVLALCTTPNLEDQGASLSLVPTLWPVRLGRPYQ
jgi:hypothetical protein